MRGEETPARGGGAQALPLRVSPAAARGRGGEGKLGLENCGWRTQERGRPRDGHRILRVLHADELTFGVEQLHPGATGQFSHGSVRAADDHDRLRQHHGGPVRCRIWGWCKRRGGGGGEGRSHIFTRGIHEARQQRFDWRCGDTERVRLKNRQLELEEAGCERAGANSGKGEEWEADHGVQRNALFRPVYCKDKIILAAVTNDYTPDFVLVGTLSLAGKVVFSGGDSQYLSLVAVAEKAGGTCYSRRLPNLHVAGIVRGVGGVMKWQT